MKMIPVRYWYLLLTMGMYVNVLEINIEPTTGYSDLYEFRIGNVGETS